MRHFFEQPRMIIFIFLALALLMVSSALIELHQSKNELYDLMEKQSHSLLEALIIASKSALRYSETLETGYQERLLNNANLIRILYENKKVSNSILSKIAEKNHIFRINIFNNNGKKIFSSHKAQHSGLKEKNSPNIILQPIFKGQTDTLIIGLKAARYEEGYRFAVAVAANDRSAIVVNIDAENLLTIRRETGFGALMRDIIGNPGIIYVALQDTTNILAASGNVNVLEPIQSSSLLKNAIRDSIFLTRTTSFDSIEVFEAIHPFIYNQTPVGLLRLGLSLQPMQDINARIYRRLLVITIVLIIIGSIVFAFLFFRQRFQILEKQFQIVETYSSDIIKNVSDAILVYSEKDGVKIYNREANRLFRLEKMVIIGKDISEIFHKSICNDIISMPVGMQQIDCDIEGEVKYLLLSKSTFSDDNSETNTILVIRDLTRQKQLEDQVNRTERLSAMGELASGVAHEIRNPLNTIGTIVQQLDRDFKPSANHEEYHDLVSLVYQEVKRINKTITEFLRFSRPEPLNPEKLDLSVFFEELEKQYMALLNERQIDLIINCDAQKEVFWDRNQIRQVFINLIQNSIDVLNTPGEISINCKKYSDTEFEILFRDTGPGIAEDLQSKIFNLYFTTKASGTGIGLSIVQRIIYEHKGVIHLQNTKEGTLFSIVLPLEVTEVR